jgi:AAA15 family ATPase/GTPase
MLLAFRVANFRSLRDEQELSMLAPGARAEAAVPAGPVDTDPGEAPVPSPADPDAAVADAALRKPADRPLSVVPVAALYGANASGKSNVLAALWFMCRLVAGSYQRAPEDPIPVEPFQLDKESLTEPSFFELEVLVDGVRHQYGFRADVHAIRQEWLYSYPAGRRRLLFERRGAASGDYRFGKNLPGANRTISGITRANALFLSVAASNNHGYLERVRQVITTNIRMIDDDNRPERTQFTIAALDDLVMRARIVAFLRAADLGIEDILTRQEKVTQNETLISEIMRLVGIDQEKDQNIRKKAAELASMVVEFKHGEHPGARPIPMAQESFGTRAWFALASPLLASLDGGLTLLVDELDSSLHPSLSVRIVEMFQDPQLNRYGAQLIFSTHDTSLLGRLLDDHGLTREQVWFTEKNSAGATELYPLTDFSPRRAENLERGYLQGRYGAVPIVDDRLLRDAVLPASPPDSTEAASRDPDAAFPESRDKPSPPAAPDQEEISGML